MDASPTSNTPRPHQAVATIAGILSVIIAVGAYLVVANFWNFWPYAAQEYIACTMEAKICPDGTGVGRTGPNCEFAPCPGETAPPNIQSGISGIVLTGPTCPVVRVDDPSCNDKPYQGDFIIKDVAGIREIARFSTDSNGRFLVYLVPDEYSIEPTKPIGLRVQAQLVEVKTGIMSDITLTFDTGIR